MRTLKSVMLIGIVIAATNAAASVPAPMEAQSQTTAASGRDQPIFLAKETTKYKKTVKEKDDGTVVTKEKTKTNDGEGNKTTTKTTTTTTSSGSGSGSGSGGASYEGQ